MGPTKNSPPIQPSSHPILLVSLLPLGRRGPMATFLSGRSSCAALYMPLEADCLNASLPLLFLCAKCNASRSERVLVLVA